MAQKQNVIEGKMIRLYDDKGRCRVTLGVGEGGLAGLSFHDEAGNNRLDLLVPSTGEPGIMFHDSHCRPRGGMMQTGGGNMLAVFVDDKLQVMWSAPHDLPPEQADDILARLPTKGIH